MTTTTVKCTHDWKIDNKNLGICKKCGEVRHFPWEPKGVSVLVTPGHTYPEIEKPLRFPFVKSMYNKQEKIDIVRQIKEKGINQVAGETGINPRTLRTWRRRYAEIAGISISHFEKPSRPPGSGKKPPAIFVPPFVPPAATDLPQAPELYTMRTAEEIQAKLSSLLLFKKEKWFGYEGSLKAEGYIRALEWVLGKDGKNNV